jgi:hypothetical protein
MSKSRSAMRFVVGEAKPEVEEEEVELLEEEDELLEV